ncbi:hypothetical protein ISS40_05470 [Candidatus Bathyarchaeota archaeon]|nr:hypothetical protein [Candidatus Bathyarchaeota archaeon]
MAIRISNKKRHIDRLNYIIDVFGERRLVEPVRWIAFIRDNIEQEALSNYRQDFNEVLIAYETILRKKGGTFHSSYEEIVKIFNQAFSNIKELLEDVTEFSRDWIKSRKQINHALWTIRKNL